MPTNDTESALRQAVAGLSYTSESDSPWQVFRWPAAKGEPSVEGVRRCAKLATGAPAVEQSVEDFFAPLTQEQDWFGEEEKADAAKYRALLEVVKKRLKSPKVVKIGERQVAVYVVGQVTEGGWGGVRTVAVET